MPKKGTRISRLAEAAEQAGLSYSTVWHRLKRGASMEEALDADLHVPRVLVNSGYKTISALANEARLPYDIVKRRLYSGWSIEDAKKPVGYKAKPQSRGRYKDLTGQKFGRLTVLSELEDRASDGRPLWWCVCDCGKHVAKTTKSLTCGIKPSCGCWESEAVIKRNTTHGLTEHPLYRVYYHMKDRCYNPKNIDWKYYGGRGIKICDEWLNDVETFIDWGKSHGFEKGLTIERIDCDKGYSPDNCTFVTIVEQQYNKHPKGYLQGVEDEEAFLLSVHACH